MAGGAVDLSRVPVLVGGSFVLTAAGLGSRIDLGNVSGTLGADSMVTLSIEEGGSIYMPLVTSWDRLDATIGNSNQSQIGCFNQYYAKPFEVERGHVQLPIPRQPQGHEVSAFSGTITDFPLLTSINNTGLGDATFHANSGAHLEFSSLTELQGSAFFFNAREADSRISLERFAGTLGSGNMDVILSAIEGGVLQMPLVTAGIKCKPFCIEAASCRPAN